MYLKSQLSLVNRTEGITSLNLNNWFNEEQLSTMYKLIVKDCINWNI